MAELESLPESESVNQDQKGNQGTDPLCLKCGNGIPHIPYRYEGKTFHARCLVCNFCGRKLVGKPFITDEKNIFCGDVCKESFESGLPLEMNVSEDTSQDSTINGALSESLIEALDSISETKQNVTKLMHHGMPTAHVQDPDQITDYPRRLSASPDSVRSRSSINGSRRSSLSAVSESSLTSEGSFSYDANRRPSRNILKNPHRPRRRSKKNVRWNLPNGRTGFIENDSDTTSLESFDSSSTSSSLFLRARNGINETRQNWKEFERAPPPGSTGMTPSKPSLTASRFSTRPSSAPHTSFGSPISYTPGLESTNEHAQAVTSHNTLALRGGSPQHMQNRFARSPSPLTGTSSSHVPIIQGGQGFDRLSRVVHSTPIRRYFSDSNVLRSPPPSPFKEKTLLEEDVKSTSDDIDNPMILKLSDSMVPELDVSTLEDRQRMHVFEFPQKSRRFSEPIKPQLLPVRQQPIVVRTAFHEDDDEADYDHLSPVSASSQHTDVKGSKVIQNMVTLRNKPINKKYRSSIISYTEDDVDDALKEIEGDGSQTSSDSHSQEGISPNGSIPPTILDRKRNQQSGISTQSKQHSRNSKSEAESFFTATTDQIKGIFLYRSESDPVKNNNSSTGSKSDGAPVQSPLRKPPPVPPKHKRIKRGDRDTNGIPKDSQHQNSREKQGDTNSEADTITEDNILPPPPEFASPSFDCNHRKSSDERSPPKSAGSDDLLGSASTSTLIADQDESPIDSKKKASLDRRTPYGETQTIHPQEPPSYQKEQPWNNSYPIKMDRIVVGAEDPAPAGETMRIIPDHLNNKPHNPTIVVKHSGQSRTFSVPSSHFSQSDRVTHTKPIHSSSTEITNSKPPPTSRYKVSMEAAFNEGNLLKNSNFAPGPNRSPRQQHVIPTEQDTRRYQSQKTQRSASIPHRPAPPPPPVTSKKGEQTVSNEDHQVMSRFFSGSKLPTMKPVKHDTDNAIKELLSELNIDDDTPKEQPMGTCAVCSKAIQSPRDCMSFNTLSYHAKCFCCAKCRSSFRGKKPHCYRNTLYCWDCYTTNNSKTSSFTNSKSYRDFHRPATGGQITTV